MQHSHAHSPLLSQPLVEMSDVSLSIDGRRVLHKISMSLSEQRIGFIGRNGSGKTSLARVICGLIKPDSGSVEIKGVDVFRDRKGALSEIGIIFQNPDHQIIFPTVEEEVAFGVRQQGNSKEVAQNKARDALNRFGVGDWSERSIAELSQGQKHLICLISVLAMSPSVIILDEPFTGLDYPTSHALRGYLADLKETVLHITHDLTSLENYERIVWIDDGQIHADGPPGDVLKEYMTAMEKLGEERNAVTHIPG